MARWDSRSILVVNNVVDCGGPPMVAANGQISLSSKLHDFDSEDLYSSKDIKIFKRILIKKKHEILLKTHKTLNSSNFTIDSNEMKDEFDVATVSIEQELDIKLLDRFRKLIREIDHALSKIENGDYGYCEGTGDKIPKRRLELTPWVRYGVEHKSALEKREKIIKSAKRADYEKTTDIK